MTFDESKFIAESRGRIAYIGQGDSVLRDAATYDCASMMISAIEMDCHFILDTPRGVVYGIAGDYVVSVDGEVLCVPGSLFERYYSEVK